MLYVGSRKTIALQCVSKSDIRRWLTRDNSAAPSCVQEVLTLLTATDEQRRAMMHAAARAGYLGAAYTPEQRQEALARYRCALSEPTRASISPPRALGDRCPALPRRYKKSRRGKFHRPVDECRSRIAQQMNRTHNGRFHSRSGSVADGGSMSASIDTTALFSGDRRGTHRRFMSMETVGSVPPLSPRMAALHHPATPSPCAGRPPRPNSSSPGGPVVPELPNLAALQAQAQGHAHGHAGNPHGLSMWSPRSAEGVPSRIESGEGPQLSGEASESLTAAGSIGIEQAFLDGLGMGTLRGSYGLPRGGSTSELGHMLQGGTWVHDGGRGGHGQGAGGAQAVPPSHLHTWGQPPPSGALR